MLLYYSASTALQTWLKTSSTGSSESTYAKQDSIDFRINVLCYINYLYSFLYGSSCTHLPDNATALIKGNDWLSGFVIQVQALLNGRLVVIRAAAGLPTLQKPLDHGLAFSINVQQQAGFANLE